uniref:1-acylglycerol-3-phosphate O-acyltransferase n=1 Tax=Biomphalaria glabrata TaxID=6526 RepID=A0A2C9LQQ5_BIOGL
MALENRDKASDAPNLRPTFLAKKELEKNKKSKGYASILSTFYLDRENIREAAETIDKMISFVKEKKTVAVIFPEGTRSKDGSLSEFKGGAFRAAKKDYLQVVPVTINNALSITDLSRKDKLVVEVIFHQPIKPSSLLAMDTQSIAKIVQQKVQSKLVKPEGKRSDKEDKLA